MATRPDNQSVASLASKSTKSRKSTIFRLNRKSRSNVATEIADLKPILLNLQLSSPSFLDAVVQDKGTKLPLYIIDTNGTSTSVSRTDQWQGQHKVADIKWPKLVPIKTKISDSNGVLLQIKGGRWMAGEEVLKPGSILSAPSKFLVPGYSHHLRWKQVGTTYWASCFDCTTGAVQGPIAILYPADGSKPAKISIYESLHDKHDTRPLMSHQGVSTLLLDYVVITAMILVTDIQEWMVVRKFEGSSSNPTSPPLPSAKPAKEASSDTNATSEQWRKIAYGEPMFPKKRTPSAISLSSSEEPPRTPSSSVPDLPRLDSPYKPPALPPSHASSVSSFHADTDESHEEASAVEEEHTLVQRPPMPSLRLQTGSAPGSSEFRSSSPSAESIFFPLTPSSAPSHTYIDPSFYNGESAPPVPPLPSLPVSSPSLPASSPPLSASSPPLSARMPLSASLSTRSYTASASSPPNSATGSLRFMRELPAPPPTPQTSRNEVDPPISPATSTRGRRLPVPPLPSSSSPDLLRRQASASMLKKRQSTYGARTLPPAPGQESSSSIVPKEEASWSNPRLTLMGRQSVFDMPPPAYNSIDFGPVNGSTPPPVPPLPTQESDTAPQ